MKTKLYTYASRLTIVLALFLGGCTELQSLSLAKPQFSPLTDSIVSEAAPANPQTQGTPNLQCKFGQGLASFGNDWLEYKEASLTIAPNGRANVSIIARKKGVNSTTLQGFFDHSGQKITFCPVVDAPPGTRIPCTSIYALDDDLGMGLKRTFDVPDTIRGGSVTCAFDSAKLQKL